VFREPLPFLRVFVKEIRVTGSTVFSPDDLAKVTAPYTNREITSEDLESLRQALTLHYVNRGYFTSGAVVPDQDRGRREQMVSVLLLSQSDRPGGGSAGERQSLAGAVATLAGRRPD
jgi:hypothetical protein